MAGEVPTLVSAGWLAGKLSSGAVGRNLRILDSSWHMPETKRDGHEEYELEHIPHASFFSIDDCADLSSLLPHMVPTKSFFESYVNALGIHNDTHVVVYDNNDECGAFSAQRVWWMFRIFGHPLVSVLDGGLPYWKKRGYETTAEVTVVEPSSFTASGPDLSQIKSFERMEENVSSGFTQFAVVDARPEGRFDGTVPEPIPGIKSGHIPDTVNVPYSDMMDSETKLTKSPDELREVFGARGVDLDKPFVATCSSGVTACVVAMGAHMCGREVPIYDASWSEWFQRAKPELITEGI